MSPEETEYLAQFAKHLEGEWNVLPWHIPARIKRAMIGVLSNDDIASQFDKQRGNIERMLDSGDAPR